LAVGVAAGVAVPVAVAVSSTSRVDACEDAALRVSGALVVVVARGHDPDADEQRDHRERDHPPGRMAFSHRPVTYGADRPPAAVHEHGDESEQQDAGDRCAHYGKDTDEVTARASLSQTS
jgi:hypothetical protein